MSSMYFCCFIIISPWKRAGPFIWTNLNPIHPRMLCAKFGWNWPSGSRGEDFFNFINVISLFHNYLPLEIWTNLNPLHLGILCAKFGWNWSSGSGEEEENVKSLQSDRRTDGQTTDVRGSEKLTWVFSTAFKVYAIWLVKIMMLYMQRQSSYKVHLNTISNGELSDPLCDGVNTVWL